MRQLTEIVTMLKQRRMGLITEATGLHANTVRAVINGKTKPSYDTVKKLDDYLSANP